MVRRAAAPAAPAFPVGSDVEVCSTDAGFKGSWYEATITRCRPRVRAYDVDYLSLVSDNDPTIPLNETVRANHVRPRLPRVGEGVGFRVDDMVDGYHNDGWWPAVVKEVGEKYTVSFPGSREVVELAATEIRPHMEWRHGEWIAAAKKEEAMFGEGEEIEVSGDRENYGALWLTGTAVKVIAKTIYLVEYNNPKEDGSQDLLREFLDIQYIRPVPRVKSEGMQFALLEEVEVQHCGVWMLGMIMKIVEGSRYVVKLIFADEKEIELSISEMRRLRYWVNGKWISGTKHRRRSALTRKTTNLPHPVSSSTSNFEETNTMSLKRKNRDGAIEGEVEALIPSKELKRGNPSDHPKTPALQKEVQARMQNLETPPSELVVGNLHVEARLQENLLIDDLCVEKGVPNGNNSSEMVVWGDEPFRSSETLSKTQSSKHPLFTHEIGNFGLLNEWGNSGVRGPRCPRSNVIKRTKKLAIRERRLQDVFDVIDVRKHSNSETRRKRVRPQKLSTGGMNEARKKLQCHKSSNRLVESNGRKGVHLSRGVTHVVSNDIHLMAHQDGVKLRDSPSSVDAGDLLDNGAINSKGNNQVDIPSADSSVPQMVSLAQDGTSARFSNCANRLNDTAIEVETKGPCSSLKEVCDVARSNFTRTEETSLDGSKHTVTNEAEKISHRSHGTDVTDEYHSSSNMSTSKREGIEDMALMDPAPIGSSLARTLPFEKSSSLWESIESMKVFQVMQQEPHFGVLEQQFCKEFREGIAIGLMVTFANMEADVRKMDIYDPQEAFEERLKALKYLEENGFDVQSLRSRIEELLDIRNNISEFQNKKASLKEQMLEREYEKEEIDAVKHVVDMTIKEVEQHLARLNSKRDSFVIQKINKESEIAEVEKEVQATEEACLLSEQQFHAIAASPW